jgi:plasmid stabilization system protein ParE
MKPIIWSPQAENDFEGILDYLLLNWGLLSAVDFADETERILHIIELMPELYAKDESGLVHQAVIVKQVTLFYRIKDSHIELLRFWNNKQKS